MNIIKNHYLLIIVTLFLALTGYYCYNYMTPGEIYYNIANLNAIVMGDKLPARQELKLQNKEPNDSYKEQEFKFQNFADQKYSLSGNNYSQSLTDTIREAEPNFNPNGNSVSTAPVQQPTKSVTIKPTSHNNTVNNTSQQPKEAQSGDNYVVHKSNEVVTNYTPSSETNEAPSNEVVNSNQVVNNSSVLKANDISNGNSQNSNTVVQSNDVVSNAQMNTLGN